MATEVLEREKTATGKVDPWSGFGTGLWNREIDVRDFIQNNVRPSGEK